MGDSNAVFTTETKKMTCKDFVESPSYCDQSSVAAACPASCGTCRDGSSGPAPAPAPAPKPASSPTGTDKYSNCADLARHGCGNSVSSGAKIYEVCPQSCADYTAPPAPPPMDKAPKDCMGGKDGKDGWLQEPQCSSPSPVPDPCLDAPHPSSAVRTTTTTGASTTHLR